MGEGVPEAEGVGRVKPSTAHLIIAVLWLILSVQHCALAREQLEQVRQQGELLRGGGQ